MDKLETAKGVSGQLSGYVFENKSTGVERDLYWNLFITCSPIAYIGEDWEPSIQFDWLRMESLRESTFTSTTYPTAEASFYIATHDPANSWALRFEHDDGGLPIRAHYELSIDFGGLNNDPLPNLKLVGSSPVELTTVSIARDDFFPKPSSHAAARALIEPYFSQIREWREVRGEEEYGWPAADLGSFRFTRPVR